MSPKTILGWAAVAFIVWFVIEDHNDAAQIVHHVGSFLATAASGFSHFISSI